MQRRTFLKTSAAFVTGACLTSILSRPLMAFPQSSDYLKTIGLQLWTVRNQLQEDQRKTIEAVKDAGYVQVELMKMLDSEELLKIVGETGLTTTSSFIEWTSIGKPDDANSPDFDKILETAAEANMKHLVFGYIGKGSRETADQFKTHAENANRAGEKCKAAGIQLCYHNHSFEFAKLDGSDKTGFDIFVEEFEDDLCKFELDVFWVKIGGWDPVATLKKLDGRVSQIHLKDLIKDAEVCHDEGNVPHEAFKELGNGTIDMAEVMQVSKDIGVEQCHVEQDQSPAPIDSINTSMQHLLKL